METPVPVPDSSTDLTLSFTVARSPREAYDALLRVPEWWIGDVEGASAEVGDAFTYAYEPYHRTVQRVTALEPAKRVEWEVLESAIRFVDDPEEWKGTTIHFELAPADGGGTEVRFTHVGLTPKIACYANCAAGWEHYILNSLRAFIETGKGVAPPF